LTSVILFFAMCALMVSGLFLHRQQQLRRDEARVVLQRLEHGAPLAHAWLTTAAEDEQTFRDGLALTETLVDQAGLRLDDPATRDWDLPNRLPEAESQRLRRAVGELFFAAANARLRAVSGSDHHRREVLEEALALNNAAREVCARDLPRTFMLQQAEIMRHLDQPIEAARLEETAGMLPAVAGDAYLSALTAMHAGKWDEAIPALEEVVRANPVSVPHRFLLGNAYVGAERISDAEFAFSTCVELSPDSVAARYHRGLARFVLRRFAAADADFSFVVQVRPTMYEAWFNRAVTRQSLGRWSDAESDLLTAIRIDSQRPRAYFLLARIRHVLKKSDEADRDSKTGLALAARTKEDWLARGIARAEDDPEGALADFRRALEWYPNDRRVLRNIAHVLSERQNKPDAALEAINRILELHPDSAGDLISRAVLYARQGNSAAARADARRALELRRDGRILFQASCVFARLGVVEEQDFDRAIALLADAIRQDERWLTVALRDPDLAALRDTDDFQALVTAAEHVRRAARGAQSFGQPPDRQEHSQTGEDQP
jgi:tetratricopeptide (TPR) repeat protein